MADNTMTFNWDDEIESDSSFTKLDPGDYPFKISEVEKSYYDGSAKIPPCNMAIVHFVVDGKVEVRERYYLCSSMEWKLSELFKSVGLKKKGEKAKMQWSKLAGSSGRCRIKDQQGTGDKSDKTYSAIDFLYDAAENSSDSWGSGSWS